MVTTNFSNTTLVVLYRRDDKSSYSHRHQR